MSRGSLLDKPVRGFDFVAFAIYLVVLLLTFPYAVNALLWLVRHYATYVAGVVR